MKTKTKSFMRTAAMLSTAVVMLFGAALVSSCSDDDDTPTTEPTEEAKLTLSPTTLTVVPASSYTRKIAVLANVDWTVTRTGGSFISFGLGINPTSGSPTCSSTGNDAFTVFVDANQATAARSATITVTGGGITRTLDLTQAGATVTDDPDDPELGIDGQTELWQQPAAATITINVTGNVDWTAAITAGSEFLTLGTPASGTGEGSFDIGLAQNTGAARAGTVTISATGVDPVIIGINQHELHTVSVDPSQLLNVPASGNTQAITVTSSTGQWEAEVTAGSDFIHLSGWDYVLQSTTTSGSSIDGNSALSIIVDGHTDEVNDRSGTVTVRCAVDGEASAYVTPILIAVTQVAYVAPPDNVNYVEINGVKWLKYNQAEAGVEPTEITVGVKFADVTTACPDGWRLPTWNEWAILATGSVPGSPWGIGNAKWTEKTTENGVTGVKHTDNNEFFLPIGENENTAYAATGDYTHIDFQKYEGNNVGWTGPAGTEPYYVRCVQ